MTYASCDECGYVNREEGFLPALSTELTDKANINYKCPECKSDKLDFDPLPAYEK